MPYHHGKLTETLIDTALDLIAERGLSSFSVAEVARRAGVSAGAPYRHFTDRSALLVAAGNAAAVQLGAHIDAAVVKVTDPGEAIAAAAGAYTRFVVERRVGLEVIFASARGAGPHHETRELMDSLLRLCSNLTEEPAAALRLLERLIAIAHGYATLYVDGLYAMHSYDLDTVVGKSGETVRLLAVDCGAD